MSRTDQQRVLAQLESAIEQAHRLQLELLGLMRSVMEIKPPAPNPSLPDATDVRADVDLPDKPMFSVEEAAAILGVGRGTAYACAKFGEIPTLRLGHRLLVPRTALIRMLGG